MTLGESMRFLREEKGYSLKDVEQNTGINNGNLSRYERNLNFPSIELCIKLADLYEVTLDELVGRTDSVAHKTLPLFHSTDSYHIHGIYSLKNLKICRKAAGLTQAEIANKINVSQQCYSDYENGKSDPDMNTLVMIADILQVSTDYLLGRTDELGATITSPAAISLSDREERVLNLFRKMSLAEQNRYIGFGEGLLGVKNSLNNG